MTDPTFGLGPPRHMLVPDWLVNIAAIGWRVLVVVAVGVVLFRVAALLSDVTAAVIISIIAAAVFAPSVANLRARGWSTIKAAAVGTIAIVVVIAAVVVLWIVAFAAFVPQLIASLSAGLDALMAWLDGLGVPTAGVSASITESLSAAVGSIAASVAGGIATAFSVAILSLFTTFFLLVDGDKAWRWTIGFVPPAKRPALTAAGGEALTRVGAYFRGAAIVATIDAVVAFVVLLVLGVPLALPLAMVVFLLGFIPYFGTLIASGMLVLATWASYGPAGAGIVIAAVLITKFLEDRWLDPMVKGRDASIHPALVLIALPIGATFGGFFGMFIVIPIVAMLVAVNSAVIAAIDPGREERGDSIVPGWLDRLAQWSWRLLVAFAFIGIIVVIIGSVPLLLIPGLFAAFIAATLAPLFQRLVEGGRNRTAAALATTGGTFGLIAIVLWLAAAALGRQAGAISDTATAGAGAIVGSTAASWLVDVLQSFGAGIVAILVDVVIGIVGFIVAIAITALMCFFFLRDGHNIWDWVLSRLPSWPAREVGRAGIRAAQILSGYMIGTAAISAFGAATQFVVMVLLGLPLALPLAVLSFFGGFIPYIGSIITTGIAFLVTVAVGDTTDIIFMGIFTLVFNIVQGNFVAPLVYGKAVSLHPAIVLLSIPAGAAIAGITGMILIVPLLGVVATTWRILLSALSGPEGPEGIELPGSVEDPPPSGSEATPAAQEGAPVPEGG